MRRIALCLALLLPVGLDAQLSAIPLGSIVRVEIPSERTAAGPLQLSALAGREVTITAIRFDGVAKPGFFDALIGAIEKAEDLTTIVPGTVRLAVRPLMRKKLGIGLSLDF
jgi:hypothetical protein